MTPKAHYEQHGYYIAGALFAPAEAAAIKAATIAAVRERGLGDPSAGLTVWMADALPPFHAQFMRDPRLVRLLQDILGPGIEFLSMKPVFKDGRVVFGSPWHQDWFYWEGAPKISIWLALDAATPANGCLRIVPGSHTRLFPLAETPNAASFVHRVPEAALRDMPVADVCLQPGDALFFHDRLLHSSHPNTSGADRWSLIPTYRSSAIPDDSKVWATSVRLD